MAQEMYKHDALLHLVYAVAKASESTNDIWVNEISNDEISFFNQIRKAEGIEINFSDFIDKRTKLRELGGNDSIINEALKATNSCGKEWKMKTYAYMVRMANLSWEGRYTTEGEKLNISSDESKLYNLALKYFKLENEPDILSKSLDLIIKFKRDK